MCDVCADFLHLLESYEARITSNDAKHSILFKNEIETAFGYIQAWPQRQCMCLYRDAKNYERFNLVVQSMICLAVHHLKRIDTFVEDYKRLSANAAQVVAHQKAASKESTSPINPNPTEASEKTTENAERAVSPASCSAAATKEVDKSIGQTKKSPTPISPPEPTALSAISQNNEESWILPEVEKLFFLVAKVFLLNFPLYIAYKHGTHARLDDISAEEVQHLAIFCDLHDNEIPVYLLRNISLFCNSGGFAAMMMCFDQPDLPVSTAHAITATLSNIKLWLNYGCVLQLFVPLRSRVLQYMCKLSDQNLRSAASRAMADFVWSAIRDPLDASINFDVEGLALAFKYFTSTTLTMRLAGMAQINSHINYFNEICTTELVGEGEFVGQKIAHWLTENQLIYHLFGPNLHVEVIKQAHVVLNFLAVENQVTEEHIKLIWQATQLKHCSKTIFDILPALVKNLAPRPAMYLYSLLCRMDPKEHTEQSIYIASALTKLIWSRDSTRAQMNMMQDHLLESNATASSSDSGSMDGSNSDDDQGNGDDSSLDGGRKSPIDIENIGSDTGMPPCKQARRRRHICDPTEEKSKQLSEDDLNMMNSKVDMKMQNHRIVNIIDQSSSDEDIQQSSMDIQMHRKKSRKRRKNNNIPMKRIAHDIVEAIWDGVEVDEATSDDADEADGEILNDSDDCSESGAQIVPRAVLKHLQGEGPYIRAIAETHISELLSGAENEGSYSSPMSNKSEKNLADFDDEDVSPCEEELAQLVNKHTNVTAVNRGNAGAGGGVVIGNNCVPPAFAAAAAAMAAAHTAMALQKTDVNVAAAAVAVAAAAVATGNAQQSLEVMRQHAASVKQNCESTASSSKPSDSDVDATDASKESPKAICSGSGGGGGGVGAASGGDSAGSGSSSSSGVASSHLHVQQPTFKINDVCQPGNTLLWDLLQDDKIGQLGETLALEAEKALATLLCFSMDRLLRTKFIEGCLHNLATNRSVIVSLRLLPKLFASFQQFRPSDTHQVTMWAERQHRMMHHFFNNIRFYAKRHVLNMCKASGGDVHDGEGAAAEEAQQTGALPIYTHKTQVSVRLHFLSSIFSTMGSPKNFRLSLEQVDSLWEWLAHDPECADCYFSWLQSQAKGGDQHALGIEALQHLYLKKLPELRPENFSMVALGLFQQLCSLARMAIAHYEKQTDSISPTSSNVVGMYHLWKIALRAYNTDVSLAAIQYINMYYMGQQLRLEKEFVSQCMDNLVQAANALENSNEDEHALMCVQRGLMLLNTHLETFRRRYAFHLRRWAIEGKGIGSHSNLKNEGAGPALRIVLQPAGLSEKSLLHMHTYDLVADLKAEISKWWETLQGSTSTGVSAPVLGLLLSEGPLRIITQGQELTSDYDERSLGDAGFKDNQIVYVSLGGRGARRKETNLEHPSMQPPPPKECLPTVLLLQPKYFEKLFCLMQTLGDMKSENLQLHTKAQLLSRRVWDILAILPTNALILDSFKSLSSDLIECDKLLAEEEKANKRKAIKEKLCDLLDPTNLQKFMYSLHIVESLALLQKKGAPQCCPLGSQNGNIMPMEHHHSRSGKGSGSSSKKGSSRRRNSNENSNSSAREEAKRCNTSSADVNAQKDDGAGSGSGSGGCGGPIGGGTGSGSIAANESDHSETTNCNDKENNPVRHNKRHKKGDSAPPPPPPPPPPAQPQQQGKTETNAPGQDKEPQQLQHQFPLDVKTTAVQTGNATQELKWSDAFIKCGGLQHLYDIFITGQLQRSAHPKEMLNEWRHDCLASLLRLLWLLGFEEMSAENLHKVNSRPHAFMLELMDVDACLRRLATILDDEAYHNYISVTNAPYQYQYHHLRTGFWSRPQVVQFAMNIMVSFVHASSEAKRLLWTRSEYCGWVRKFLLEDPEPAVRREICAGLYRISMGNPQNFPLLMAPLLRKLISFLPVAERITCFDQHSQYLHTEEGKEPYGPACRDYFWLLVRMVDTLTPDMLKCSTSLADASAELMAEVSTEAIIDIERMCQSVAQSILKREYNETRHGYHDDGLVGLINLMSNFVKYDPPFKFSQHALDFIEKIFEFLFDMPSPTQRQKPKCKSGASRASAYDLLVELCKNCPKNYIFLHGKLLAQHTPGPSPPYPWDYWPRDEGRSECGYVGLTNLGATCYMASCIQHLYMMPQARAAILNVPPTGAQKHGPTLMEMQRMFAYLFESERKAYNPRSFCRVYQMDHQPLNTGEQKDMAEFFIDLVSKLEEMTPELKNLVKRLFCGTLSNNVVSLDCDHVSRTAEEFYTVRCQVADMRNLQESLDEVTVKDTLEGDNMYTCSQCGKKVRAEKRACFKKLPQILCFNTMRYTFNMVTMLKEKVNTHFSFPMRLNMSDYVEKTLMPHQYKEDREKRKRERDEDTKDGAKNGETEETGSQLGEANSSFEDDLEECFEYELVGVTVHTGTADGGHYYSFIKDRNKTALQHDRWFLFNDAEVKPFDPSQIAAECFGGEMTSKTYDSVTEKYLDFSFEKTNSAYMLFYERRLPEHLKRRQTELLSPKISTTPATESKILTIESTTDLPLKHEAAAEVVTASSESSEPDTADNAATNDQNGAEGMSTSVTVEAASKEVSNESVTAIRTATICDINISEVQPSTSAAAAAAAAVTEAARMGEQKSAMWEVPRLNKELEDWIWQDNRQYLQDRNIFEHTYFNFMWQICSHIPQTLIAQTDVTCIAAKLSVSFFIETFIHAKEKPTMVLWVEMLTKQFNISQEACEWFLTHMSLEPWWPVQVLIQCPNQMVRQMFQRLIIHVIQRLRSSHAHLYLNTDTDGDGKEVMGNASCVTRFISSLILLMEHGAKAHLRNLSEYFGLLLDFSRMGDEETVFLLRVGLIKTVADFYLGNKSQDCIDVGSDNDDNSSDEALSIDKSRPASLDKMIGLVASLVERSRGQDLRLRLSTKDFNAIAGGKGFPFLYQQIKDNINPHQTKHLIHALCRWDERLAAQIISMLFASVTKHTELCGPFFKLLTLLTESQGGPSGLPCFSQLVLQRVWDAAEYCPQSALDWLAFQAPKNKIAHAWILQSADNWLEQYLMAHNNGRVRNAAAFLLVSLVPSQPFRGNFRTHSLHKLSALSSLVYRELSSDAQVVLHNVINLLLRLLRPARSYADIGIHGTSKLTAYFSLLSYCMVSKTEKLMIGPFMRALWELFHPRLSEPSVPAHHNKHALLAFWHQSLVDCPENALTVANSPEITRNIAFNYILADHDDSEIVAFNRSMLPAYYGLLRLCCEQSRALTRQLAAHQNLQWGFKNITPHPTQYSAAADELFKLMTMFATRHADASEQEKMEVTTFRRTTLSMYLTSLDARVSWSTLINALKILVDNDEDRLLVIYNGGIEMCFEALHTLHSMHHEATACHVAGDLQELLNELVLLLTTLRMSTRVDSPPPTMPTPSICTIVTTTNKNMFTAPTQQQLEQHAQQLQHHQQMLQKQQEQFKQHHSQISQTQQKDKHIHHQMHHHLQLHQMQQLHQQQQHYLRQQHHQSNLVKGLPDAIKRLATLLNTFNPPEICRLALDVLKELVRNPNLDITSILAPILINCHLSVASAPNAIGPLGPYFPRRGNKSHQWSAPSKNAPRPPRPMVQMCIPHSEIIQKGIDIEYDAQVEAFYRPYHDFLDVMMRMAVNTNQLNDTLVKLSCLVAIEAAPLHFHLFPKFWVGIHNNTCTNKYAELLIKNQYLVEYIHIILRDERVSLSDQHIRSFLEIYYPKISTQLPIARLLYTISYSMHSKEDLDDLCGDLFAIRVIAQCTGIPTSVRKQLRGSLKALLYKSARCQAVAENEILPNKKLKLENEVIEKAVENEKEAIGAVIQQQNAASAQNTPTAENSDAMETSITSDSNADSIMVIEDKINDNVQQSTDGQQPQHEEHPEQRLHTEDNAKDVDEEDKEAKAADDAKSKEGCDGDDKGRNTDKEVVGEETKQMKLPGPVREVSGNQIIERTIIGDTIITTTTTIANANATTPPTTTNKNANKKSAEDRLVEEQEKRYKLLLTMETYIKSILALMQKEENTLPPITSPSLDESDDIELAVAAAAAELSTSDEGPDVDVDVDVDCDVDVDVDVDDDDDDEDDDDDGIIEMIEPMSISQSDNDIEGAGATAEELATSSCYLPASSTPSKTTLASATATEKAASSSTETKDNHNSNSNMTGIGNGHEITSSTATSAIATPTSTSTATPNISTSMATSSTSTAPLPSAANSSQI